MLVIGKNGENPSQLSLLLKSEYSRGFVIAILLCAVLRSEVMPSWTRRSAAVTKLFCQSKRAWLFLSENALRYGLVCCAFSALAERAFYFCRIFEGGCAVAYDDKREQALRMLTEKASELGRLPKRGDFDPEDVCFIKQKLGPFPRALEQAGLKPVLRPPAALRSKQKRKRAAERRKLSRNQE